MGIESEVTSRFGTILAGIALSLTALSCSKQEEPKRLALLPADTIIVLAFDEPNALKDPAVAKYGPEFGKLLADKGISFAAVKDPIYIFTKKGGGCLFHSDNPADVLSRIKGKTDRFQGKEIIEIQSPSGGSPIWWAELSDGAVVFGGKVLVSEMISIAQHRGQSLFQARPELRKILTTYQNSPRVLLLFQRREDTEQSEYAKQISERIMDSPEGQIFRTLTSCRGLAFSLTKDANGCEQELGFQFDGYTESTIAGSIASILPWGPDAIQPISTSVNWDGNLIRYHAKYNRGQCPMIGLGFERLPPPRGYYRTWDALVGRYSSSEGVVTISQRQGKLFAESSRGRSELQSLSETEFRVVNSTDGTSGKFTFINDEGQTPYILLVSARGVSRLRKLE